MYLKNLCRAKLMRYRSKKKNGYDPESLSEGHRDSLRSYAPKNIPSRVRGCPG